MNVKSSVGLLALVIMLLCTLLSGCGESEIVATLETTGPVLEVTTGLLDSLTLELSPNITRERISDTRDAFIRDGQVIGGIVVMNLDAETVADTAKLVDYLQTNIVEGIAPEAYSYYMAGSSKYGLIDVECGTRDREFTHYIYEGNSAFYDVWVEDMLLNSGEIHLMTASAHSADIPGSGESAFSLDQVTEIAFDDHPLPNLDDLQGLWDAVQADIAAGTAIPDAGRHGSWFHYDSDPHDNSYISLGLSTDTDVFGFLIYPECENTMTWMAKRNILNALGAVVAERNWEVSFEVIEADATHVKLRCTRDSGHACRLQMEHTMISGSFFMENPNLYILEEIPFGSEDTAEVTIDWTERMGELPAGDYELKFYLRNTPPDTNDWYGCKVAFTIPG